MRTLTVAATLMGDMSTEQAELARALYEALAADDADAFMGEFVSGDLVTIDGRFDLARVAAILLRRQG